MSASEADGEETAGRQLQRAVLTFRNMMSCLASPSGTSWWRRQEGGTQRRLGGGTGVRPEARGAGPGCRALSVLPPVWTPAHCRALLRARWPRLVAALCARCSAMRLCYASATGPEEVQCLNIKLS